LELEVAGVDAILDPVVAHIDGFAAADLCRLFSDAPSRIVVVDECSRRLRVAEVFKGLAVHFSVLGVDVHGGVGCLSSGADDCWNDGTGDADGPIDFGWMVGSEEGYWTAGGETCAAGAGFGLAEVRFVGVDMELHVRWSVDDGGVGVVGNVIEESIQLSHGVTCGVGLLHGYFGDSV
jgi:hypothetical protein